MTRTPTEMLGFFVIHQINTRLYLYPNFVSHRIRMYYMRSNIGVLFSWCSSCTRCSWCSHRSTTCSTSTTCSSKEVPQVPHVPVVPQIIGFCFAYITHWLSVYITCETISDQWSAAQTRWSAAIYQAFARCSCETISVAPDQISNVKINVIIYLDYNFMFRTFVYTNKNILLWVTHIIGI